MNVISLDECNKNSTCIALQYMADTVTLF